MSHRITLLNVLQITPDTRHYVFTRPDDYAFTPGQATELALDLDGWRDEGRPFTFTGDPDAGILAFIIKSYPDHKGVTAKLATSMPGATALIGDVWGAIEDRGPGVFLAAGAGITPFIPILQARARAGTLQGCALHFANKTQDDVILRDYWRGLDDLDTAFVFSDPAGDTPARRIDGAYLDGALPDYDRRFYVCGPPPMEDALVAHLKDRGVADMDIIREDH